MECEFFDDLLWVRWILCGLHGRTIVSGCTETLYKPRTLHSWDTWALLRHSLVFRQQQISLTLDWKRITNSSTQNTLFWGLSRLFHHSATKWDTYDSRPSSSKHHWGNSRTNISNKKVLGLYYSTTRTNGKACHDIAAVGIRNGASAGMPAQDINIAGEIQHTGSIRSTIAMSQESAQQGRGKGMPSCATVRLEFSKKVDWQIDGNNPILDWDFPIHGEHHYTTCCTASQDATHQIWIQTCGYTECYSSYSVLHGQGCAGSMVACSLYCCNCSLHASFLNCLIHNHSLERRLLGFEFLDSFVPPRNFESDR